MRVCSPPLKADVCRGLDVETAVFRAYRTDERRTMNKWKRMLCVPGKEDQFLGWPAVSFIVVQILCGILSVSYAFSHWRSDDPLRFACYLAVALSASVFKVRLPGIEATMSANFLFILVGIMDLSPAETILMGSLGGLIQSLWQSKPRPKPIQLTFNLSNIAISIVAAEFAYHSPGAQWIGMKWPLLLAAASTTYFVVNTMSVSGVIALTQRGNPIRVWKECYLWSFPYYLLGALIAGVVSTINHSLGWQVAVLILPVVYWIYRSYRIYLNRLETEKKHSDEVAALHLRTIEALSLAIEAKDHTTHDHLKRVQAYAIQIGEDLGLPQDVLDALRAASLLHDIGKLAVPEQILSKPGRLTPEEFERMKIHPIVGSEILSRVQFPYPVVPIVRSHHERWDGKGYPDGLQGEDIPIGARILSVVDCFDALTSERPYRRARTAEEAIEHIRLESGRSYDPRVVDRLEQRYVELEQRIKDSPETKKRQVFDLRGSSHVEPAAGVAVVPKPWEIRSTSFLASIVSARQEAQLLFELAQTLGNSLSLRETLSVVAVRLKEMIPHDSIVFYVLEDDKLVPRYIHGVDYDIFSSLRIPMGQGISGWVAQHRQPIVNGDPAAETKYLNTEKISVLQSALSIPLPGRDSVAGVLSLYMLARQGFTKDHLRLLLAASTKLGLSVENALQFERAQDTASTDFLTELPNARSICAHLEKEISRCGRTSKSLAVLVCDLNGFKSVNDNFGHLVGNKLLQQIARNLSVACRDYDQVGRLGGDEFVFVLPELSREEVDQLTPRLQAAVEDAALGVCMSKVVSVSIGSAYFPDDGETAEELLSEADRRMYETKEHHYKRQNETTKLESVDSR
jgi:diguanylate cyclase (GGDEF)-like protein/putative nucleotidyltransferase with HDIG domain